MNARQRIWILAFLCWLPFAAPAFADLAVKDGNGSDQTIFDFTCFTSKHCTAHVNINSAGTEIFTSSNPGYIRAASAAFASGAFSSGAFASGALALGAGADGWDVTQGAVADAAWTGTGNGTNNAVLKSIRAAIVAGTISAGIPSSPSLHLLSTVAQPTIVQPFVSQMQRNSTNGNVVAFTRAVGVIKVYGIKITCATATTIIFQNGTSAATSFAGSSGGGDYNLAVNTLTLGYVGHGLPGAPLYQTTGTNDLVFNKSAGNDCAIGVWATDS